MMLLTELLETYLSGSYCNVDITVLASDDGLDPEEVDFIKGVEMKELNGVDNLSRYFNSVQVRQKRLERFNNLAVQTFWKHNKTNTLCVILKRGL